ncbi:MAG: Pr6Pr family membrane protein [Microbacteriaceae bacterium]
MTRAVGILRLVTALVGVIALIGRYYYGLGNVTFSTGNYIAYLTIQSNIAAVLMFTVGGIRVLRGRPESSRFSTVRMLVTSCLVVAGSVFIVLVAQSANFGYPIGVPWSDSLLHFVIPAFAIVDWVLAPGRRRTRWALSLALLGYPVVWGVITLIRGEFVGWYPYFFMDPYLVSGPLEFAAYSAAALAVFIVVALLLTGTARIVTPLAPTGRSTRSD